MRAAPIGPRARPRPLLPPARWLWRLAIGGLVLALAGGIGLWLSPALRVPVIAWALARGGAAAVAAMASHAPRDLQTTLGERFASAPDLFLDVYRPKHASGPLPALVWLHGGAWIAGSRRDVAPYLRVLAAQGFATVAVDYSLAPGARHPTQVQQANAALAHLDRHADRLGIDRERLVLGGDAAGAQIASQLAAALTAPAYAARLGVVPGVRPEQVRGVVLFCGPYDLASYRRDGGAAWFTESVLWAFTGSSVADDNAAAADASVLHHVTAAFPPAFLSVGNADPLAPQSRALASRLEALGVEVTTLFHPADHRPPLAHGYQFDLGSEAGRVAVARAAAFVHQRAR